jgi:hypothetical protein
MGFSSSISGANNAFLFTSSPQLNLSAGVTYCTGSVSATAHTTHASGTSIADIQRNFKRTEAATVPGTEQTDTPVIEAVVPLDAWALAPAADGLHILVKRSLTEVVEFVLPWDEAREVH